MYSIKKMLIGNVCLWSLGSKDHENDSAWKRGVECTLTTAQHLLFLFYMGPHRSTSGCLTAMPTCLLITKTSTVMAFYSLRKKEEKMLPNQTYVSFICL